MVKQFKIPADAEGESKFWQNHYLTNPKIVTRIVSKCQSCNQEIIIYEVLLPDGTIQQRNIHKKLCGRYV